MKSGPTIERLILDIRSQRVILAGDLAMVYGVVTRRLNEQVRRNTARFPGDFIFQLTQHEFQDLKSRGVVTSDGRAALRSQNAILKRGQHIKFPPYAFTEHGAIMAAMVLSSPKALAMSVYVVRAFIGMREQLAANPAILTSTAGSCLCCNRHPNRRSGASGLLPTSDGFYSTFHVPSPRRGRRTQNPSSDDC